MAQPGRVGRVARVHHATASDAWGSDDEEIGIQDQYQPHPSQQHNQHKQQQQRLAARILAQLPVPSRHLITNPAAAAGGPHAAGRHRQLSFVADQRQKAVATAKQRHLQRHQSHEQQAQQHQQQQQQQVPSLQQLCLGILGQHITELVQQLQLHSQLCNGSPLFWMPADMKAALLAVARRRGALTAPVLALLADVEWRQLDLAGCGGLTAAELLALSHRMPHIQVLDVTGFDHLSAAGWRKLARAFPLLTILRLGGSASSSSAALKALPHILPGLLHPAAAAAAPVAAVAAGPPATAAAGMDGEQGGRQCTADCSACCSGSSNGAAEETAELEVLSSWEDAFQYDWELRADQQRKGSCCCGSPHVHAAEQQQQQQYRVSSRLQLLRVLVWPDVPDEAVQLVQQQCPRILINPAMVPDPATGHLPPAQVDPGVPLDAPWMQLAGPHALRRRHTHDAPQPSSFHCLKAGQLHTRQAQGVGRSSKQQGRSFQCQKQRVQHIPSGEAACTASDDSEDEADEQTQQGSRLRCAELQSSHVLRTLDAWLDEV